MQLISTGAQYAVTSVILLAREENGKPISAAQLALQVNAPTAYLSQTLAKLVPPGIVGTSRGKSGGVFLARKAEEISMIEIVRAIDGEHLFTECVMGMPGCSEKDTQKCPFHDRWGQIRSDILQWLTDTTLRHILNHSDELWLNKHMKFTN